MLIVAATTMLTKYTARLTQWRGAQRGFVTDYFGEFDRRFNFVEQAALTKCRTELLAAGAVLAGLQNSQRFLGEISSEEDRAGRGMLTAIIVSPPFVAMQGGRPPARSRLATT
ncbi:hypothetical protein ACG33_11320 [Steroidobacter denitrificans]|uniref:Uncharacterized protein n=1 Tax=Steroidobacter denitrificans TaxID=465721 RepID=A0A127FDM4_STEDE|nr:hypothetical protein ACG33_11320 [Steroidobacter denitrificans]